MSSRWRRMPSALRTLHAYCSLTASFAIAFYAATGLIAELRGGDDEGEERTAQAVERDAQVPIRLLDDPAALAGELRARLALAELPRLVAVDDAFEGEAAGADGSRVELVVRRPSGALQSWRWQPLPADAPRTRAELAAWFAHARGGDAEAGDDPEDAAAPRVTFSVASVWWTRAFTVDRVRSRYSERLDRRDLGSALADLHSGKHAGWWQRRLMDAVALSLLFSTVTGVAIGVAWVAARRRRLAVTALIGGSAWLVLLIVHR